MGRRNQVRNFLPRRNRKWLIAIYIRLSKEDGNDVSNSIIHQEERLNAYLSTFGDAYELVDVYKEACAIIEPTQETAYIKGFRELVLFFQRKIQKQGLIPRP
jgi:hypothetical protein